MSDNQYPTLNMMGVTSLNEIERYSIQTNKNEDVLRIVYKRKKNSLLPASKKFRFGRSERTVVTDSGSSTMEAVQEISPHLAKAVAELDQLVNVKLSRQEKMQVIQEEIQRLEEETHTRIQYIKALVKECE